MDPANKVCIIFCAAAVVFKICTGTLPPRETAGGKEYKEIYDKEALAVFLDFLNRNKSSPGTVGEIFTDANICTYLQEGCDGEQHSVALRVLKEAGDAASRFLLWTDYSSSLTFSRLFDSFIDLDYEGLNITEYAYKRHLEKMQVSRYLLKLEEALNILY